MATSGVSVSLGESRERPKVLQQLVMYHLSGRAITLSMGVLRVIIHHVYLSQIIE